MNSLVRPSYDKNVNEICVIYVKIRQFSFCISSNLGRHQKLLFFSMIRLLIGSLVFTGTMVSYMLRVSLNIAIVTMTDIDGDNMTSCYCSQNATDDDQRYK